MEIRSARVVALTRYLGLSFLAANWASSSCAKTVKAIKERFGDKVGYGLKLSWHPTEPGVLHVREENLVTDGDSLSEACSLESSIGDALIQDLEALALVKARKAIEQERDERLARMAQRRVARVVGALQTEVMQAAQKPVQQEQTTECQL